MDNYLIFSPLQNIYAFINKKGLDILKQSLKSKNVQKNRFPADLQSLVQALKEPLPDFSFERTGPLNPKFLGLIPSRKCNMSCIYCNFGSQKVTHTKMDPKTAIQAIDYMANLTEEMGKSEYTIQFFGGEPFIEDEIIDTAVHHARFISSKIGIFPLFEASTNGYFNNKKAKFISEYFDKIVLSLDGFKEFHDRTRPININKGSFEEVVKTAYFLSESPVKLSIRCCITQESVSKMEDMALWFCNDFKPSVINFEPISENENTQKNGLLAPDPYVFAKNLIKSWRLIEKQGYFIVYAAASIESIQTTFCPLGKDAIIVTPEGKISACYLLPEEWEAKGMDLIFGEIKSGGEVIIDKDKIRIIRQLLLNKPRCANCFCRYSCAGGCHVNQTYPGCLKAYNDFCIHTRLISCARLLDLMGLPEITNQLFSNKDAMEKLAKQKSDFIMDTN